MLTPLYLRTIYFKLVKLDIFLYIKYKNVNNGRMSAILK